MANIELSTVVSILNMEQLKEWRITEWLTTDEIICLIVGVLPSEYKFSWYCDKSSLRTGFEPSTTFPIYNIKPIEQLLLHEINLFENRINIPGEKCFFSVDDIKKDESDFLDLYCFRQSSIRQWLEHKNIESIYFKTTNNDVINGLDYWKAIEWLDIKTLAQLICDFSPDKAYLIDELNMPKFLAEFNEEPHSFIEYKLPDSITPVERQLEEERSQYYKIATSEGNEYRSIFTPENVRFKCYPTNRNKQVSYLEFDDGSGEGGEYQVRQSVVKQWLEENGVQSAYFGTKINDSGKQTSTTIQNIYIDYADPTSPSYSSELDIAVIAHKAIFKEEQGSSYLSNTERVQSWLTKEYPNKSKAFYDRITTVVLPKKKMPNPKSK